MTTTKSRMFELMAQYLSKSDIYASTAIATISAIIINRRQNMGMTQSEFAKFMGVSQGMISKWESSEHNFTIETVAQIAEKLNLSFEIEFKAENNYLANRTKNVYANFPDWSLQKNRNTRKDTSKAA